MPMREQNHARESATTLLPLEAQALTYTAGGQHLIHAIDLVLDTPGITMIMGPNGAGKSLLLRLLNGLVVPSAGRIVCAGVRQTNSHRQRQAMVFQKPILLRRSVRANIDFVLNSRNLPLDRRDGLLTRVGLLEKAAQPARLLSGGEQQRLALARALALDPQVLFLDEPTASLDPASVMKIETLVTETRDAGKKIIFVTHDLGQARRLADDIVFLHQGRLVEQRPAQDFFNAPQSEAAKAYIAGRIFV